LSFCPFHFFLHRLLVFFFPIHSQFLSGSF
jgi:hypothetical protein